MKTTRLVVLCCCFAATLERAQETPVVIRAGTLLDGRGHILHNVVIVVENGKIARVEPSEKSGNAPAYDLRGLTVMPGWIDLHDHVVWHFGPNGRLEDKSETARQAALAEAANAYATLMASGVFPNASELKDSVGGQLGFGYRRDW